MPVVACSHPCICCPACNADMHHLHHIADLQIVLDVLGAMIELVEALACQRLALAPFTRQGGSAASGAGAAAAGEAAAPSGLLRVSGHCYSVWAQPLHPVWLQVGRRSGCRCRRQRFTCRLIV